MNLEYERFQQIGQALAEGVESKLFGKPCFKIGTKAFVCFFQEAMVFKLQGDKHSDALSLDGAKLFDPSGKGRPMKEWVQVPYAYEDRWVEYAQSALNYEGGQNF